MHALQLRDTEELETLLAGPEAVFLKHSPRCGLSTTAYRTVAAFHADRPGTPLRWIDVLASRPLSDRLAAWTGVPHASPQVLWLVDGALRWHGSHFAITREALEAARGG